MRAGFYEPIIQANFYEFVRLPPSQQVAGIPTAYLHYVITHLHPLCGRTRRGALKKEREKSNTIGRINLRRSEQCARTGVDNGPQGQQREPTPTPCMHINRKRAPAQRHRCTLRCCTPGSFVSTNFDRPENYNASEISTWMLNNAVKGAILNFYWILM